MKFTLSSLKEYLTTKASLEEICAKLTAIGLEVESVEDKAKVESLATSFESNNEYNMKKLIVKTSAGCVANE